MQVRNVFHVVDLHAGGEPLRIVVDGYPPVPGATMLDRRQYVQEHWDPWRRRILWEPWGHRDLYGCLLLPPERAQSLYGLLFMHSAGYSTMSGHAVIAVAKMLVETGRVPRDPSSADVVIPLDVPSGQVVAHAVLDAGGVDSVWFESVPAFARALDVDVNVDGVRITLDVGYGGAFYAIVPAESLGLSLTPGGVPTLRQWAARIRVAVESRLSLEVPGAPRIAGLHGTLFTEEPRGLDHAGRQTTVFADGQVDRSPGGSGITARLAILAARGRWAVGVDFPVEGLLDTVFTGRILGPGPDLGPYPTVRTTVSGRAHIIAFRRFFEDPNDPVAPFLIR